MNKLKKSPLKNFLRKLRQDSALMKVLLFTALTPLFIFSCKKITQGIDASTSSAGGTLTTNTATGDEFTVVVLPDTQYYTRNTGYPGGSASQAEFDAQVDWIRANAATEKIAYVVHLGDIVDNPDRQVEWDNAKEALYKLETPLTGYPNGIPYGLAVGNHDQLPDGAGVPTGTNPMYDSYFGVSHFSGKPYYGGHFSYGSDTNDNDNHYDFFSAGGIDFIVIYMEYDDVVTDPARVTLRNARLSWADNLLVTYSTKKAIIVTHNMVARNGTAGTNYATMEPYSPQGQTIYDKIKSRPNVVMMLGGHVSHDPPDDEGYCINTYNGHTIRGMLSDYQDRPLGGGGFLRLLKFSKANDKVSVSTYSPYAQSLSTPPYFETDGDSQFTFPLFHEPRTTRTCDFNNNGKSELALYNQSTGVWKTYGNSDVTFGVSGDLPVNVDYNGDGDTETAIWRPSDGSWHLATMPNVSGYGNSTQIPVPADYDGDGMADIAVFDPGNNSWHYQTSYPTAVSHVVTWGASGCIPAVADYDGDGKADLAYWLPSNGTWYINGVETNAYGVSGDIPIPGDYDGDGHNDYAVFRRSDHTWHIKNQVTHATTAYTATSYVTGDIPAPGDYDGDGKTDITLYRPSTGQLINSSGTVLQTISGASAYKLVNLPYGIRKFFFP